MSLDLSAAAGRVNGKGLREIGGLEIVLGVARKLRQVKGPSAASEIVRLHKISNIRNYALSI